MMVWIANMASNVGTQIQSVGEKWQMAHLTASPLLVALIETGTTLPVLLLGLSAGALADILDRRRLLITTQVFMLACAAALSGLTFMHQITPLVLLSMSFLIGTGSALSMPAFQAIVPELLDRDSLVGGVALNSAGFNVSRAVGPALGGLIVGLMGAGWAFCFNAVSFLAVVVALLAWNRRPPTSSLPGERFLGALKVGYRYARHSRPFQVILLRAVGYSWFAGVIFSLLPTLAIHDLKLGSEAFGALMGCVGLGAVVAVFFLGPLRRRFSTNQLLAGFSLLAAAGPGGHRLRAAHPHRGALPGVRRDELGGHPLHHQHRHPAFGAAVGEGPGVRHLPHRVGRRDGAGRGVLGRGGAEGGPAQRHGACPARACCWPWPCWAGCASPPSTRSWT